MSRIGKIARLPEQIRLQINRRLQDGENGRKIIEWLNSTDEVKAILSASFAGRPITDGNLSEWKLGGYQDWQSQEIALAEARRVMTEGRELAQTAKGALADHLAAWIMGRYIVATRKLARHGDKPRGWKMLRELCHDHAALRRGEHNAERLRLGRERLKLLRKKQKSDRAALKQEILKENPPPKALTPEEKDRRWREIFGISPDTHPMLHGRQWNQQPDPAPSVPNPNPTLNPNLPTEFPPDTMGLETSPVRPASPPEDPETTALRRLTKLAEAGDPYSQYCLGTRYRDGLGVPQDYRKAREWLVQAAAQKFGNAVRELHVFDLQPRFQGAIPGNSD